ncbi:O-antigen ligase-related protein [Acididesulfobacillus acetoxydans]|uniref:O-antigen ligase like membrane protein n=1 Tax=Acididesulfobacillus acetoxydans TaxID=1561005 RepID=A0A8S0WDW8_9FIRM|nr:oligosaccharide repeat unit polymerase [Acididesulfobacillus acetoxydans]CAA7599632.1 O-antigen ligase-related protein [Acididesulfobacillus acetoxydans]CEJ06184.1 O-antigen ligase like membrane protein [Acididesulfobacillus acetoxydans]
MNWTGDNKKLTYSAIYSLFILGNLLLGVQLWAVDLYAFVFGLLIINKLQWESKSELLYNFVLLFAIMDFTFNLPVGHFNVYYLHIALFILTVSMFIEFMRRRKTWSLKSLAQNRYLLFLSIFILYMILSLLWVTHLKAALKYMVDYAIMICFALAVYRYNPNLAKLKQTVKFLFFLTVPALFMGLLEILDIRMPVRNIFIDEGWYAKGPYYLKTIPTVFWYNPNNFGTFLVLAMSFILAGIAFAKERKIRWGLGILQVAILINIIFSTSRTAYITMLVTMLGFLIYFSVTREKEKRKRAFAWVLVTLVVFYSLSFVPQLDVYFGKFNNTEFLNKLSFHGSYHPTPIVAYGDQGSTSERYTILVDVVKGVLLKGHPEGFGVANTPFYIGSKENTFGITNVHSLWFEILGDFGVGIFLYWIFIYLSLLWALLKRCRLSRTRAPYSFMSFLYLGLLAALAGFILTSFAPSSVINFTEMWLLLSLAVLVVNKGEKFLAEDKGEIFERSL